MIRLRKMVTFVPIKKRKTITFVDSLDPASSCSAFGSFSTSSTASVALSLIKTVNQF